MINIEVGDIVIVPKFGSKTFKTVDRIIYDPFIDRTAEQNMTILLRPYGQCKYRDVSVIRKPRPGGKEARDIVAMLARDHHKSLNATINSFPKRPRKPIYQADKLVQSPYRKAKAMLKNQS